MDYEFPDILQSRFYPVERVCDPPEDPEWPTPYNSSAVGELVADLPPWAAAVCAIVAARVVWPMIASEPTALSNDDLDRIRSIINTSWRIALGELVEVSERDLISTQSDIEYWLREKAESIGYRLDPDRQLYSAIWTVIEATRAATGSRTYMGALTRLMDPYYAVEKATVSMADAKGEGALERWWKECRCALAFIMTEETELS